LQKPQKSSKNGVGLTAVVRHCSPIIR
jgi:hypothetical protein